MATLLVIVPDRLSEIVAKGEFPPRYYNPGNLFDEVHILMTNDDRANSAVLQPTVGTARLCLHNLPVNGSLFLRSVGFRPQLLRGWAQHAVTLARQVQPALIRCHNGHLSAFAAAQIKAALGVPYVVSLHTTFDERPVSIRAEWKTRLVGLAGAAASRHALRQADLVLPVYQAIVPYVKRAGVKHFEVVYNILNPVHLVQKTTYELHRPVRVLSVGRQIEGKNPENLLRASAMLPCVHLTLVGNGSRHNYLRNLARSCGVEERVTFHRSLPNDQLCRELPTYDIFATHSDYWEIPKAVMEPLLTGLPVIVNRRPGSPVPEYQGDFLIQVENTPAEYHAALKRLIEDDTLRSELGRRAYAHAQQRWAPARIEARVVALYKQVMQKAGTWSADR